MLEYFLEGEDGETDETINGLRQIAIHLIGKAGYGMHESWRSAMIKSKQGTKADMMTYVGAVNSVINHLILAAMLPAWLFALPIMPQSLQNIGIAKKRFEALTKDILENERKEAATRPTVRKNLMSTLVALSDAAKDSSGCLTEQISGNLVLFTAAGYDTTANSLAYGITILAAEPKWQELLYEEIAQSTNPSDYEAMFPSFIRTRAFMFETLRLYNPIVHIQRLNPIPQTIQTSKGSRHIPAGTHCFINSTALQCNPATWGADALSFSPKRWRDAKGESIMPAKGTFLPWSAAPRICPGMKMAQVEFVGVLTTLLRRSRIEVVARSGGDEAAAREKLWDLTRDSQSRLTLQMNRPGDVGLRFVRGT